MIALFLSLIVRRVNRMARWGRWLSLIADWTRNYSFGVFMYRTEKYSDRRPYKYGNQITMGKKCDWTHCICLLARSLTISKNRTLATWP